MHVHVFFVFVIGTFFSYMYSSSFSPADLERSSIFASVPAHWQIVNRFPNILWTILYPISNTNSILRWKPRNNLIIPKTNNRGIIYNFDIWNVGVQVINRFCANTSHASVDILATMKSIIINWKSPINLWFQTRALAPQRCRSDLMSVLVEPEVVCQTRPVQATSVLTFSPCPVIKLNRTLKQIIKNVLTPICN